MKFDTGSRGARSSSFQTFTPAHSRTEFVSFHKHGSRTRTVQLFIRKTVWNNRQCFSYIESEKETFLLGTWRVSSFGSGSLNELIAFKWYLKVFCNLWSIFIRIRTRLKRENIWQIFDNCVHLRMWYTTVITMIITLCHAGGDTNTNLHKNLKIITL